MYTRNDDIEKIVREAVEKMALDMPLEEIEYDPAGAYGLVVGSDADYVVVNAEDIDENSVVHIYGYLRRVQADGIRTVSSAQYIDGKWIEKVQV